MGSNSDYSCKTCLYSNVIEDGVECDKKLLLNGKTFILDDEKAKLPCPSHSSRPIEEWRYMRSNDDVRDAEDACGICGRLFNELNKDDYEEVTEIINVKGKDENGKEIEEEDYISVTKCRVCIDKGRNLFGEAKI